MDEKKEGKHQTGEISTNGHIKQFSNVNSLSIYLINELEQHLSLQLDETLRAHLSKCLSTYDETNSKRIEEEKNVIINELKQNLVQLTEKRFRQTLLNANSFDSNQVANLKNIEFLINEKENQIAHLTNELEYKDGELRKLKEVIKQQDNVILSHNTNIHDLKQGNDEVLKAKQESFRVLNDDLKRKQKQIDDQSQLIKQLKEKIEFMEADFEQSRKTLEKRLSEKENDLKVKIATFEANLYEGKQYFEEILAQKDSIIKEKQNELIQLKLRLGAQSNDSYDDSEEQIYDSIEHQAKLKENNKSSASLMNDSQANLSRIDDQNMENMKQLYEHQMELLKVKIELLEKTCQNYQQGIKEMNKSFGLHQQNDELASIQVFKDILQESQKTNARLETEKIDLEVKCLKLKEEIDTIRVEKENLTRKFHTSEQLSQRLQAERDEFEANYRSQLDQKQMEVNHLYESLNQLRMDFDSLLETNNYLNQIKNDHDQLKVLHEQLSHHYEQLYNQATDIVNGNQLLNEQCQTNMTKIESLQSEISELNMKCDHLQLANSNLNTEKVNLEVQLAELREFESETKKSLVELERLKAEKKNALKLGSDLKELEKELWEKNELIDQLNQAKEFLAENNSQLLTNNIKIQLFIESMGLDMSLIESNQSVKEYDDLREQYKQVSAELTTLKQMNKQSEENLANLKSSTQLKLEMKEKEISDLMSQLREIEEKQLVNSGQKSEPNVDAEHLLNQVSELNNDLEESSLQKEKLLNELNEIKQKSEEKIESMRVDFENLKKENLKYKLKLKKLLKKDKETKENGETNEEPSNVAEKETEKPTETLNNSFNIATQTDILQPEDTKQQVVDIASDDLNLNLVHFGATMAVQQLHEHTMNELNELNDFIRAFLAESKHKYDELQERFRRLNVDYENVSKKNQEQEAKVDEFQSKLKSTEQRLNEMSKELELMNEKGEQFDQCKQENERLSKEFESTKSKLDELTKSLEKVEQQNSKYKAKLKQMLGKNKKQEKESSKEQDEPLSNQLDNDQGQAHGEESNEPKNILNEPVLVKTAYTDDIERELNQKLDLLKVKYEQEKEKHKEQLEELTRNHLSQLKEYEMAYLATQQENQSLVEELIRLKETNSQSEDEKVKQETELNDLKQRVDELTQKLANAEQLSLKYKAKLKQTLNQNKQLKEEQPSHLLMASEDSRCATPTIPLQSVSPQHQHSTNVNEKQIDSICTQTEFNLDEEIQEKLDTLNRNLVEEFEIKMKHVEETHKHQLNELNNSYIDQLKQYESSFLNLQNENESLLNQIESLKQEKLQQQQPQSEMERTNSIESQIELTELKQKVNELSSKLASTEQLTLKYKAKLKQVLNQSKQKQGLEQTSTSSLLMQAEDSRCTTPLSFQTQQNSPNTSQLECKQFEMASTQTEWDFAAELEAQLSAVRSSLAQEHEHALRANQAAHESQIDELNYALSYKEHELKQQQMKVDYLNETKAKVEDLTNKLNTSEQLNLKYKAKLKQLMNKQKLEEQRSSNTTPIPSSYSHLVDKHFESIEIQTDLDSAQLDLLKENLSKLHSENKSLLDKIELVEQEAYDLVESTKQEYENRMKSLNETNADLRNHLQEVKFQLEDLSMAKKESTQVLGSASICDQNEMQNKHEEVLSELKTLKEQNLKLKAKLKKQMAEKKNEAVAEAISSKLTSEICVQTERRQEEFQQNDLMIERENLLKSLESKEHEINCLHIELKRINEQVEVDKRSFSSLKETYSNQMQLQSNQIEEMEAKLSSEIKQADLLRNELIKKEEIINEMTTRFETSSNKLLELESLIKSKQSINDDLLNQLDQLKRTMESQKNIYETQIDELNRLLASEKQAISQKFHELLDTSSLVTHKNDDEMSQVSNAYSICNRSVVDGDRVAHLEEQLKYCHQKCEKVVGKLNQLKKQNETLNSKIKSFKSMMMMSN